jgi:hypothetical protein
MQVIHLLQQRENQFLSILHTWCDRTLILTLLLLHEIYMDDNDTANSLQHLNVFHRSRISIADKYKNLIIKPNIHHEAFLYYLFPYISN